MGRWLVGSTALNRVYLPRFCTGPPERAPRRETLARKRGLAPGKVAHGREEFTEDHRPSCRYPFIEGPKCLKVLFPRNGQEPATFTGEMNCDLTEEIS